MLKRKREAGDDGSAEAAHRGAAQQRVQHKLKVGVVKLGHAFKIAKGFERQKLSRRLKTAQSEKKELDEQRISAEISAIKTLNTSASAQHFLYKTLSKIKVVAASPKLPKEVTEHNALSANASLLNVHARLCNSNPVKDALQPVLKDVGKSLGVDVSKNNGSKKKRLRAKDHEDAAVREKAIVQKRYLQAADDSESREDDGQQNGGANGAGSDDSEEAFARFDDRLAFSGAEAGEDDGAGDDLSEDGSDIDVDVLEKQLTAEGVQRSRTKLKPSQAKKYDHAAVLALSGSGDDVDSAPSPEPRKAPAPKKSAFIPSLTLGGYISGSGSDIDDDLDIAPRKNRRGQQARRAIAEKKYGAKAKHLQKQDQKRDQGWDPKRGATEGGTGDRHGKAGPRIVGKGDRERRRDGGRGGFEQSTRKLEPKHRDDSGPIHPSWEAAKKAKERKEAPVPFQGKKITFD